MPSQLRLRLLWYFVFGKISVRSLICVLAVGLNAPAQSRVNEDRKPVGAEAYANWVNLAAPVLSDEGHWVAYTLSHASGGQELVVHSTRSRTAFRIPRGILPRNDAQDTFSWREMMQQPTQFSAGSRFLVFESIEPVKQRTPSQDMTGGQLALAEQHLGILQLPGGELITIPHVASYSMPRHSGRYLAYTLGPKPRASTTDSGYCSFLSTTKTLVLRDVATSAEVSIANVTEYVLDDRAKYLAYIVIEGTRHGAYVRRIADGRVFTLQEQVGRICHLTFDVAGEQLAFLAAADEGSESGAVRFSLHYVPSPVAVSQRVVPAHALNQGERIDAAAGVRFTGAGNALVFSIGEAQSSPRATPLAQGASRDLWHWQDPGTRVEREVLRGAGVAREAMPRAPSPLQSPSNLAVYHIKARQWTQLGHSSIPWIVLSENAQFAVGITMEPYALQHTWNSNRSFDVYFIDVRSGSANLFRRGVNAKIRLQNDLMRSEFSLSPSGRYLMFFERQRWWSVDLETHRVADLTGALLPSVRFGSIIDDEVPMGVAGWTQVGGRVLLYSTYDVWEIDPAGMAQPRNLTDGVGEQEDIVFRLWGERWDETYHTSAEESAIDPEAPLLLIGVDQKTKASSIWHASIRTDAPPKKLLMVDKHLVPVAKAAKAQQYLLTLETYGEYPDLWTGSRFDQLRKVSDANPQQHQYAWGSVELIEYVSDLGIPQQGLLYKPEGFDPTRRYPMIVNFYGGRSSFGLHHYSLPMPTSAPPVVRFVSNGYVYFVPDIEYRGPYVARTITAAVLSGVHAVLERGFVDPARIGIIGFSFGGYEVGALVAETDLFRCAVSSAGPVDPVLYYGSLGGYGPIYVETGQWSHGGSLWQIPWVYMSNSVLMQTDRIRTPLLLINNEWDTSVPYSQGAAFFHALQRNGRPAWLVRYPGEGHTLENHANRLDQDRRIVEFFDHYLRDSALPAWM